MTFSFSINHPSTTNKKVFVILFIFLALGLFLRLYHLDFHDVVTDEAFYGLRSISLIDFLGTSLQPTPFEWFDSIPRWAYVSFHDHPPLTFWIEHLFFLFFGVSAWVMRLPFALAGTASIALVFLIANTLFQNRKAALVASALLSVNTYHIWISRIGLQESLLIFFILLSVWLFVRFCTTGKGLYLVSIAVGLSVLVKYTAVILIPIFFAFLFLERPQYLSIRKIISASLLFFLVISPIIIYNVGLFNARGHFDFQLSYLLGQDVPEWESRPGREVGGILEKTEHFFTNFVHFHGILFSTLSALALIPLFLKRKEKAPKFIALALFLFIALFMVIGPQERFLVLITPFIALALGLLYARFADHRLVNAFLVIFLFAEILLSVNTHFTVTPYGKENIHYSSIRNESPVLGFNDLEAYFLKIIDGAYPQETFPIKYEFIKKLQGNAKKSAQREGKQGVMRLFVTDSRMSLPSYLWYFERYIVYEGWPMISDENYLSLIQNDKDYFRAQGFTETFFIKMNDSYVAPEEAENDYPVTLENMLVKQGKEPAIIYSESGKEAFKVYRFSTL